MLMKTKILHYLLSSALLITGVIASEDLNNQEYTRPVSQQVQHAAVSEQGEEASSLVGVIAAPAAQNQEEEVSAFAVDEEPAPAEQRRLDNNPSAQGDEGVTQINTSSTAQLSSKANPSIKNIIHGNKKAQTKIGCNNLADILEFFEGKERPSLFIKTMSSERFSKNFLHSAIQKALFPDEKINLTINEFEYIHSYYQKYINDSKSAKKAFLAIRKITSITLTDDNNAEKKEGLEKISKIIKLIQSYPNINTIVLEGILPTSLDMDLVKNLVKKESLKNIKAVFAEKKERNLAVRISNYVGQPPCPIGYESARDQELTVTSENLREIPNVAKTNIMDLTVVNTNKLMPLNFNDLHSFNQLMTLTLVDFSEYIFSKHIDPSDANKEITRPPIPLKLDKTNKSLFSGISSLNNLMNVKFLDFTLNYLPFKLDGFSLIKLS